MNESSVHLNVAHMSRMFDQATEAKKGQHEESSAHFCSRPGPCRAVGAQQWPRPSQICRREVRSVCAGAGELRELGWLRLEDRAGSSSLEGLEEPGELGCREQGDGGGEALAGRWLSTGSRGWSAREALLLGVSRRRRPSGNWAESEQEVEGLPGCDAGL